MSQKKGRRACDASASKVVIKNLQADNGLTAEKSQAQYLARRFGLTSLRAALVASLAFSTMEAR